MTYVAVVVRKRGEKSHRPNESWECFVSDDKDEAIQLALAAASGWDASMGASIYEVHVGTLSEKVETARTYQLKALRK